MLITTVAQSVLPPLNTRLSDVKLSARRKIVVQIRCVQQSPECDQLYRRKLELRGLAFLRASPRCRQTDTECVHCLAHLLCLYVKRAKLLRHRTGYTLDAAREFPSQKPCSKCTTVYSASVNVGSYVVAAVLVTGTTARVW
jgi:hypothetical protein